MAMTGRVRWTEGVQFVAETGSGHALVVDGAPEAGGRNTGPRPMELLLLGLGGCAAFDVVTILRKGRQAVEGCVVDLAADRAETEPRVFTDIRLLFTITGSGLARSKVERAVALSAEKYCSASIMLGMTARITHEIRIVDTAAAPVAAVG